MCRTSGANIIHHEPSAYALGYSSAAPTALSAGKALSSRQTIAIFRFGKVGWREWWSYLRPAIEHANETIFVADALVLVDSQTRANGEQTRQASRKILTRRLGVCEASGGGDRDGSGEGQGGGKGEPSV
jgi:hypothetical protein